MKFKATQSKFGECVNNLCFHNIPESTGEDVIIGVIFLCLYVKRQLKNCYYFAQLINHRHTNPRMFNIFVYFPFSSLLYFLLYILLFFFSSILYKTTI